MKEGRDDEEAGTVERDTSQPEAVSTLGEKTVVVIDREAGFSDSHQVRPLQCDHEGIQGGGAWLWRGGEVSPDSAVCVWALHGEI